VKGFADALALVLLFEGGYVNDPDDPGGATNRGVTQARYNAYRTAHSLDIQPVQYIEESEVQEFYRIDWLAMRCDQLPYDVALVHFDAAVNQGKGAAPQMLQEVCGVTADGVLGPRTLGAAVTPGIADRYVWRRLQRYRLTVKAKPPLLKFLPTWLHRMEQLHEAIRAGA
jgi:lysozyme family protein